jgi:hypothetical protein
MATGQWPTIVDVATRTDPEGNVPEISEMLSQCNDYTDDAPYMEANEKTGHEFVFRTSIPTGSWRSYNQGTPYSKSTTAKARVGLGMLADWSQVDRSLLRHSGQGEKFRRSEDFAFLEGMSQTIAQTLIYGNTTQTPAEFMGLAPFYNTINTNNAQNAANVLSGGGTGNNNTSLWYIGWSPKSFYLTYPRGSTAGIHMEDRGDTVPAYDNLGNPYLAFTSYFEQEVGLVPQDWRYGARVCNIDVTNAGLAGPNALDIFATMAEVTLYFPKTSKAVSGITKTDAPDDDFGTRRVWYCNRTLLHWMYVQAMRDRNVLLRLEDYAGIVTDNFRGDPIKNIDQILNTETNVT